MKEDEPKIKEVYVQTDEGEEEPEQQYISSTLIVCTVAILILVVLALIVEFLVGWGPIFTKLFDVMGIS